jgi:hypothetical protein
LIELAGELLGFGIEALVLLGQLGPGGDGLVPLHPLKAGDGAARFLLDGPDLF